MVTRYFLGEPPAHIKQWIIENTPYWTKFGIWLKSFNTAKLPQVGSYVTVPYKVDPNGEAVDTEWQILGYNKDIPSRVRYINGKDEIFVPTMNGNKLSAIGPSTPVYSGKETEEAIGTLGDVSEEIKVNPGNEIDGVGHTYGNNNPYDAPESVNFDGKDWTFAGYNATVMSKYGLVTKYDGILYVRPQFDSRNHNDWKTSDIREWLNGTEAIPTHKWNPQSGSFTTGTIVGLLGRLSNQNFIENLIPTVTRTWVYADWRDGTETNERQTLVDKFWLLGEGNINANRDWLEDDTSDTSIYNEVFTEATGGSTNTRERSLMNEDGTEGSACRWWLRSAYLGQSYNVGFVDVGGGTNYEYNGASGYNAVLPACLIG